MLGILLPRYARADEHEIRARGCDPFYVCPALDSALRDDGDMAGNVPNHRFCPSQIDRKCREVPRVHADRPRPGGQGGLELGRGVNLDQRRQLPCGCRPREALQRVRGQRSHDKEHGTRSRRPRLHYLQFVEDKVLA